ncbi:hypothetical protein [Brevibacterium luteolum]|uniref:hypothetical protein n=1 Tax=Brevibacterium luteolum TaxID=199591 RepID=UPI00223BC01C|nr:hypothetical protein [Brevibacterium luteolum]MCT1830486.1 hypothetical protein [Brevibacterium luteolum]
MRHPSPNALIDRRIDVHRSWIPIAAYSLGAAVFTAFLLAAFYPGNANIDIVAQAFQAMGESPYHNWHPPVVAFVWEMLFRLTGTLGSLFVLQAVLYGLGGWLLCVLIWRRTGSVWLGFLGLALPAAPWSLSQVNVLWKDTQSALALLAGLLLIFFIRPRRLVTWWLLLPGGLLLIYGIAARKNAVSALLPIAVFLGCLLVRTLRQRRRGSNQEAGEQRGMRSWVRAAGGAAAASLAMFAVIAGGVVLADKSVAKARDVEDVSQASQIMLDDVMFVLPDDELRASGAPQQLIDKISAAREKCIRIDEPYDAYWNCYGMGETGRAFSPIAHREELKDLWVQTLTQHPVSYLQYRAEQYWRYLTFSRLIYWPAEWQDEAQRVRLGVQPNSLDDAAGFYVRGTNKVVPFVYLPWFWMAVGAAVCGWAAAARRLSRGRTVPLRAEAATLAASALMYILAYFPTVPEFHFRYTYWPAVAITAAGLMLLAGQAAARRARGAAGEEASAETDRAPWGRVSAADG